MLLSFGWNDLADLALSIFLILAGLGLAYALWRLGATLGRASTFIKGTERELLPVISKVGETVDRVNDQLEKVDRMTDSAVDAVESVDAAVRTVSAAVRRPVQKLAGLASGVRHGASTLRTNRDWRGAVQTGKEEAARREHDLESELDEAGA
jgi:ABC-type transporter Mla subunit MlaD